LLSGLLGTGYWRSQI